MPQPERAPASGCRVADGVDQSASIGSTAPVLGTPVMWPRSDRRTARQPWPNRTLAIEPRRPRITARFLRMDGSVLLDQCIDAHGQPVKTTVARGSGFSQLDEAALHAANAWRFAPPQGFGVSDRARSGRPRQCIVAPGTAPATATSEPPDEPRRAEEGGIFVRVVHEIAAIEKAAAAKIEKDSAVNLRIDADDSVKTDIRARGLVVVPSLARRLRHAIERSVCRRLVRG